MKLLAVTSCPSGVAHTYMAAEALETAAKGKGWQVKVETQGSIGIENEISTSEVSEADIIILTKDIAIKNEQRFEGKKIVRVGVADAVKKAPQIMEKIEKHLATQ
ncbi:PTS fructose-like transporter subunit IIB [Agarivorans sp. B2Z047]|jgi:fructose-specific PTS system IIB-like component|uniref:PTS fructose-like transporter subunit IIB n=1 Tax=Agarivorans TaxID=261825 RepID=UPI00128E7BBC|nr:MULTISPECIES: PTS fructose-like transporter subunit IIB [Agarivorans]MPW31474.1 PTS fructose-like transporter subunit IIB [Agarivorans sp. B2Z047]UQN42516.1 PTS fructose-like transporter subunit IIB [Agarivorans sp. B2Z047]